MRKKIWLIILLGMILIIFSALDKRLRVVEYEIETSKVTSEVRLALVTDLHSCYYGENQEELFEKIAKFQPDAVLMGGDIFDDMMDNQNARIFAKQSAEQYKTYYVSGNHEWWSGEMGEIFSYLKACGVSVLRGGCDRLEIRGNCICICGVDDPEVNRYDPTYLSWQKQLEQVEDTEKHGDFTLLLAHRPELAEKYFAHGVDAALSGHAHGGQFRIPLLLNGFYAPNQGFFPELAGGMYDFDGRTLIVSRGLSDENSQLPRIFNRPELVFVTIMPD